MSYTATYSPEDNKLRLYSNNPPRQRDVCSRESCRFHLGTKARPIRRADVDTQPRGFAY
ncbi:hypothetical protein ACPOL_6380 [Acidisarcina polymorpha]|uniref:Uncharacterized protein n=1 Tax=Acidisarcina polymorpha TaxID=2211140 RepID=A0A2Z5G8K6_9BACT|nr:hypothetical protein ACPOL_6380 [Acidisarcina polymorpha]